MAAVYAGQVVETGYASDKLVQVPEVHAQLEGLNNSLQCVRSQMERLYERLGPVLTPQPPQGKGDVGNPEPMRSPIASQIAHARAEADMITGRLAAMVDILEI